MLKVNNNSKAVNTSESAPIHILFADDDSDESYLFNEALEHSGLNFVLSHVNDGNSLLSFLKNKPLPDLVIIDINMPYKDGLEALVEIRAFSEYHTLPLIIYSTAKNAKSIETSYQKGANLFIVKPNNFDGMVRVLKKVCAIDWRSRPKPLIEQFVLTEEA